MKKPLYEFVIVPHLKDNSAEVECLLESEGCLVVTQFLTDSGNADPQVGVNLQDLRQPGGATKDVSDL